MGHGACGGGPDGRVLGALAATVLGGVAVVGLYVLAVLDPGGRAVDDSAMRAAMSFGAGVRGEVLGVLDLVGVGSVTLAVAVLVGFALLRGDGAGAVRVVAIVLGAQVITQLLKAGLPRPGSGTENSLPSGHVTLVASLGLVLVIVAPRALRPLATLIAAGVTVAAGGATMVVGWHRPSDVVAAVAVVAGVAGFVALVGMLAGARPAGAGTMLSPARAGTTLSPVRSRPGSADPRIVVPVPRSARDGAGRPRVPRG